MGDIPKYNGIYIYINQPYEMCLEMVDGPLYGNSSRKQMIKHQHLDTNADGFGYVIWDVSKSNLVTFWAKFQWFCSFNNHILNHSNTFPHQMVGLHIPWRFPCSYPIMSPHSLCSLRNVTFFSSHSAFFFPGTSTGRHSVLVQLECTPPGGGMNIHHFDRKKIMVLP